MEDMGEDRISKLPESLIHHILSFLPTKCAVSTTVLSKTWRNLWVSLPVLDFSQWRYQDTGNFMDFMDRTLLSNNITSTVQKFCLYFDHPCFDETRVREWIIALIKRRVEELILTVNYPGPKLVPQDLFTCESLTMLDFNFEKHHVIDFPQSISLPKLKVLRLSCVVFKDMASTQQLFSSCSIEELVLCKCSREDLNVISFSAPRLKFFALKGYLRKRRFCYNLQVEIDAPNLLSIEYRGWLLGDFLVGSFPSLVEADFRQARDNKTSTLDSLSEFVRTCSNIRLLKASYKYFQIFDIAKVPSTSFPTFDKLVCLEVDYDPPHLPIPSTSSLFKFLHFAPNLESLVINQVHFIEEVNGYELMSNATPHCLLVSLKSIRFRNFKALPKESKLVKLLLKHARVLQLVVIRKRVSTSGFIQQLLNFHRASTHCKFQLLPRVKRT